MALRYLVWIGFGAGLCACAPEAAEPPVYLSMESIPLQTDYPTQGTAHNRITTAWIYADQEPIGAFELPFTVPALLPEGINNFTIYPGVNLNGMQSVRAIYDAYEPIRLSRTKPTVPGDTLFFRPEEVVTNYRPTFSLFIVEDFDQTGLNLEAGNFSDTSLIRISDPDSTFDYNLPLNGGLEDNGSAGFISLTGFRSEAEFQSVTAYNIPPGTPNVYLEVTYRSNVNINFGVVAQTASGEFRAITTTVFPQQDWHMIHIDLITEILAFPGASGYKVYLTARKPDNLQEARIFLDNIKLAYRP